MKIRVVATDNVINESVTSSGQYKSMADFYENCSKDRAMKKFFSEHTDTGATIYYHPVNPVTGEDLPTDEHNEVI